MAYTLLLITWFIMYKIGFLVSLGITLTYLQFSNAKFVRCKALAISLVWFIMLPIVGCYVAWQRRHQIQGMLDQVKMLQQMQEQLAAINQLAAFNTEKGTEGDKFD